MRILALVLAITVTACVTTEALPPGSERNLREAARLNTQLGIDYMRNGQFDLALEKLRKALEQDDSLAVAHSSIAFLHAQRGEKRLAELHYREALDLNANDAVTLNNFGIFLCGQGEVEDAVEYFLEAARLPGNATPADAWANAGVCSRRTDRIADAEEYLREALRLNPRHANALAQMAWLSFQTGEFLRSRAFLQRYEAVAPPTAETLWIGARTERNLGDNTTARTYERRLETGFPDAPETYEMMKARSGRS